MEVLLKNGHVFTPRYAGVNDVLIENGVITCIRSGISVSAFACAREMDITGMYVVPGFIDAHVHIAGGGGEAGEASLIPPMQASDLYDCGITGCVGMLGFEKRKRNPQMLYEKTREFNKIGLETKALSGSYQMPPISLYNDISEDLHNLPLCMGVGEVALLDTRAEVFLMEQIVLLLQTVHKAAKKTQKPLKIVFHIGNKAIDLSLVFRMAKIYPNMLEIAILTHINRNRRILKDTVQYIKMGGMVDVTAGILDEEKQDGFIPAHEALQYLLKETGSLDNITLSSDAGGSIPVYAGDKTVSYKAAKASVLSEDLRKAYRQGMKLSELLKTVTVNPARAFRFMQGEIKEGAKAYINIADDDLNIKSTLLNGEVM